MTTYISGPLPFRRFGRSLGIDVVPFKTCSYDCIYCEFGRTTCKTTQRKVWVSPDVVLRELATRLSSRPNFITLGGCGELTLHSQIHEVIRRVKAATDIPVAALTNGSLLWCHEVRQRLLAADLVMPSLDAGNEAMWQAVNHPCEHLQFEQVLSGLCEFRAAFRGEYCLEVLLLEGYTTSERELADLVRCVDRIGPDRVQLNTVVRPLAESCAVTVSGRRLSNATFR